MRRIVIVAILLGALLPMLVALGPPVSAAGRVDWNERQQADVRWPGGWRLTACEGDAPFLCADDGVADGDLTDGTVELLVEDLAPDADVSAEGVAASVADFHESVEEDRLLTCPDHDYEGDSAEAVTVGGVPGYRFGFTLRDPEGAITERAVLHVAFDVARRFLINTSFTADEGCPGPDPNRFEFDVTDLDDVEPHLDELAATSDFGTDFVAGPPCRSSQVPSSGFGDIAGNSHEAAVACLAWHDVAAGRGGDRFDPAHPVARGQLATFVARLIERAGGELPQPRDQGFTDLAGNVHADRINQLAELGLVRGTTATTFEPDRPATRAQSAALVVRAYEHLMGQPLYDDGVTFSDVDQTHAGVVSRGASAALVSGRADGRFEPSVPVRRDQAAAMLARTLNRLGWVRSLPAPD